MSRSRRCANVRTNLRRAGSLLACATLVACTAAAPPEPSVATPSTTTQLDAAQRIRELHRQLERAAVGSDERPDLRMEWFERQRRSKDGKLPPNAVLDAIEHARRHNQPAEGEVVARISGASTRNVKGYGRDASRMHDRVLEIAGDPVPPAATWAPIGPSTIPDGQTDTSAGPTLSPVSGRVAAIAVDPSDEDVVYVGGAQGGVWKTTNATSGAPAWTALTDFEVNLAVGDIAVAPSDPQTVYVGTGEPNGSCDSYYGYGVLRSTDGGATWDGPLGLAQFAGQAISKLIVDPADANRLYAAVALGFLSSGTAACDLGPNSYFGAVWRSDDGGDNWSLVFLPPTTGGARIHDMLMDPTDSSTLWIGVRPAPATLGGVWKITDADSTPVATRVQGAPGLPDTSVMVPGARRSTLGISADGETLYVAFENSVGSRLWGLFRSTDGGANWTHVDNNRRGVGVIKNQGYLTRQSGLAFSSQLVGRTLILNGRFAARVEAVVNKNVLQYSGLDVRPAGRVNWSIGAYPTYCDGQCFYDMTVGVDPHDTDGSTLYVGGNPRPFRADTSGVPGNHSVWKSTNFGASWGGVSQGDGTGGLHVDDHEIAFSSVADRVYDGNDGGIWRSDDGGVSWTPMNELAITQFQGVSTHPTDPAVALGGTQDNGTNIRDEDLVTPPAWFHTDFGDGGRSWIDQSDPSRMYHTYFNQSGNFMGPARSDSGGDDGPGNWDFVGAFAGPPEDFHNGMDPFEPVSFYAPLEGNPGTSPNVIYFGTNRVYRSENPLPPSPLTRSWDPVSPDLTTGGGNFLSAIGVFPGKVGGKEIVYSGASDGRVAVSTQVVGGLFLSPWTVIDDLGATTPDRFVTAIEVHPTDPDIVWIAYSGFGFFTPSVPGHVYKVTGAASGAPVWTDVSGDLPDLPVNALAYDPYTDILYAGGDIGIFSTGNGGASWDWHAPLGHPIVAVFDLERNLSTGQILSATHGRGIWELVPAP